MHEYAVPQLLSLVSYRSFSTIVVCILECYSCCTPLIDLKDMRKCSRTTSPTSHMLLCSDISSSSPLHVLPPFLLPFSSLLLAAHKSFRSRLSCLADSVPAIAARGHVSHRVTRHTLPR